MSTDFPFWGDPFEWVQHLRNSRYGQKFDQHRNEMLPINWMAWVAGLEHVNDTRQMRAVVFALIAHTLWAHESYRTNWFERPKCFDLQNFLSGRLPRLPRRWAAVTALGSRYTNQITAKKITADCSLQGTPTTCPFFYEKRRGGGPSGALFPVGNFSTNHK